MVAVAPAAKTRTSPGRTPQKAKRSLGSWILIAVPVLLGLFFVWQLASPLLRTDIISHTAVAVSRVTLEPDAQGTRINLVVVDKSGSDTTVSGEMTIKLREPDGAVWQTTKSVSGDSFTTLSSGGLLNGRLGYSILVPANDWMRAPRHGGSATVTISVQPGDGSDAFSTISEERFP